MPDWSSYSPRDLLMFSARTYYRLLERHHHAIWPVQLVALAAGIALLVLLARRDPVSKRLASGVAAAAWLTVGWSYFCLRFATIHTGGRVMAGAFGAQALLLAWKAARRNDLEPAIVGAANVVGRLGWVIAFFSIVLEPFVGRLLGRPWAEAELFAVTPDATAAATIGLLLVAPRSPWYLWPIPVAWSLFSGLTLYALRAPEWWLVPAIALAGVAFEIGRRKSRRPPAGKPRA